MTGLLRVRALRLRSAARLPRKRLLRYPRVSRLW